MTLSRHLLFFFIGHTPLYFASFQGHAYVSVLILSLMIMALWLFPFTFNYGTVFSDEWVL